MRINILLYNGPGVSAFQSTLMSQLRTHLSDSYDVIFINDKQLINDPWEDSCALLVLPGGQDLPYLKSLEPLGTSRITKYVQNGGNYFGICAGAYFASSKVEFEVGTVMEVVGKRPLMFFPGTAVGSVSKNFTYNSELGAASIAIELSLSKSELGVPASQIAHLYVNGGPYFKAFGTTNTYFTVLGRYASSKEIAIVECLNGNGKAILSGPHIEIDHEYLSSSSIAFTKMNKKDESAHLDAIIPEIKDSEALRHSVFQLILQRFGLRLNLESKTLAASSIMWLSCISPIDLKLAQDAFRNLSQTTYSITHLIDNVNSWIIYNSGGKPDDIKKCAHQSEPKSSSLTQLMNQWTIGKPKSSELPLALKFHDKNTPLLPKFNILHYQFHLLKFATERLMRSPKFGSTLIYAETTTSTQTILDK